MRQMQIMISTIPSVPQRLLCPGSSNHTEKGEIKIEREKKVERVERKKERKKEEVEKKVA